MRAFLRDMLWTTRDYYEAERAYWGSRRKAAWTTFVDTFRGEWRNR
jgi:hypothetical protein